MTDRPILFSAPMVRALMAGRKTQTRRILKSQPPSHAMLIGPELYHPVVVHRHGEEVPGDPVFGVYDEAGEWGTRIYIEPGDRLWVREALDRCRGGRKDLPIWSAGYAADGADLDLTPPEALLWITRYQRRFVPSIHMPRWASRLTLTITDVRVQRLHDISQEDAQAEGAYRGSKSGRFADDYASMALTGRWFASARGWYADLWDQINGEGAWDANPWVAAYTFTVEPQNIDNPE